MFAVIKTGGKQYRVAVGDVISVEKLPEETGETIKFDSVLMHGNGDGVTIGTPMVEGAVVTAEILDQYRGKKVVGLKKRRRKHGSARRWGHRQSLTKVRIAGIPGDADGSAARAEAASSPKPEAPAAPVAEDAAPVSGGATASDDLTKLPGVTPEVAAAMNAAGVTSYAQISDWGPDDWDRIEDHLDATVDGDFNISRPSILAQANRLIESRAAASEEQTGE